jgi:hypothetical protein
VYQKCVHQHKADLGQCSYHQKNKGTIIITIIIHHHHSHPKQNTRGARGGGGIVQISAKQMCSCTSFYSKHMAQN